MKIKYEFADGTVSEVEMEESIGAVIIEDRRLEDNLSRKERYHCYSLDAVQFDDDFLPFRDVINEYKSHLIIVRQFILRVIVPINKIRLNTGLRRALFSMDRNYVRK